MIQMRCSTDPVSLRSMTTEDLRRLYLIDSLFEKDTVPMIYSDIDRSITGSAVPVKKSLKLLSSKKEMAAEYFTERRELGVINIGGEGVITADGQKYPMRRKEGLYVGRGVKEILFSSNKKSEPAEFYFVSYPAHKEYPIRHVTFKETEDTSLGSQKDANKRTIHKYFHPRGFPTCQLVMGLTELDEGNVWNTFPPHTHQRRSEVYMYFGLEQNGKVVHLMGQPEETRHIILRNKQAVLSPSWSIHSGVGTQNYSFIWAMGGENQTFEDMDAVNTELMR